MDSARRRATYEDLCQVPDRLIAEIIDGELIVSPHPAIPHLHAATAIVQDLGSFDPPSRDPEDSRRCWWTLYAIELHFGEDVLVPDVSGWSRDRLPVLKNVPYLEQAPDWACEIVSPHTERLDRMRKMPIYAREQVSHLWLVDPIQRTLEVYRLENQDWTVVNSYHGAQNVRAEPFEALEIDMSRWWLEQTQ